MQLWQSTFLGRRVLPPELSEYQIQAFFTFGPEDIREVQAAFRNSNWIPAALQLGFLVNSHAKLSGFTAS